jgi:hypothetical protein
MLHVEETPRPASPTDPTVASAYQWLLALGFPADAAAASLMPELFTQEIRPPESRPGRPRFPRIA